MAQQYRPRVADQILAERLQAAGAVVIEGARACGKTRTAQAAAASQVLLDTDQAARELLQFDASIGLEGPTPRLIDEWQLVPTVWNAVRREVDQRSGPGQFILTGSATPADDVTRHSGAGRFSRLRMRPMSLCESGLSTGAVSLAGLLDGRFEAALGPKVGLDLLIDAVCRGGWPAYLDLSLSQALGRNRDYVEELVHAGIETLDGRTHDPRQMGRVLAALARHASSEVAKTTLAADVANGHGSGPGRETVSDYLVSLERLMVSEPVAAWAPHLRSRARLRSSPVQHLVDPSLAVAALRATPDGLRTDLPFFGLLFESLVVRDLRVYAGLERGQVSHYRDSSGLEVDAIVETDQNHWAAFEVKLGSAPSVLDQAAAKLNKFAATVDQERAGPPAALAVITGTGHAYRRQDGIHIIPIATLGP